MKNSICIIDDDDIYVFALKKILQLNNLCENILIFKNGEEAIHYFNNFDKNTGELPDLILLDINMPIMDGWEFMDEYIKLKPQIDKYIPIYIVSSSINHSDVTKARSYNDVSDYLIKPLKVTDLKRIIVLSE